MKEDEGHIISDPFVLDRARLLNRVDRKLTRLTHVLNATPNHKRQTTFADLEGNIQTLEINPVFLYGMWRARLALLNDLIAAGEPEVGKEIIEINKRASGVIFLSERDPGDETDPHAI